MINGRLGITQLVRQLGHLAKVTHVEGIHVGLVAAIAVAKVTARAYRLEGDQVFGVLRAHRLEPGRRTLQGRPPLLQVGLIARVAVVGSPVVAKGALKGQAFAVCGEQVSSCTV